MLAFLSGILTSEAPAELIPICDNFFIKGGYVPDTFYLRGRRISTRTEIADSHSAARSLNRTPAERLPGP
jgi:hypothetical protein